ncbi:unnamed protein product [Allacma fusca]|uniref:Ankyrin repeat family A protein 2 n=1 Tax=Allacma fusca TaxID=39272 RepID=A0A8J2LFL1_9HEXA|nr:unnamed protein product [Allacma fusca]
MKELRDPGPSSRDLALVNDLVERIMNCNSSGSSDINFEPDESTVVIKTESGQVSSGECSAQSASSSKSTDSSSNTLPEIGGKNSAFLPYKQQSLTILTNLQRGNVQTHTKDFTPDPLTFHERVAKGEVDFSDITDTNVNSLDQHGYSPLMWACFHGRFSTVQMLVEKGAEVNFGSVGKETALMLASTNGHFEIVAYLLTSGAQVDSADENGNTALMYATIGNHIKCITELLHHGASLTKTNQSDDSAFRLAVAKNLHGAQQAMEIFLKEYIELNLVQQSS